MLKRLIIIALILNLSFIENSYGQSDVFTVSEGEALQSTLQRLSEENTVLFAYPSELINGKKCNKAHYSYEDLDDLLDQIMGQSQLEVYKQSKGRFLIRDKAATPDELIVVNSKIYDSKSGTALPLASVFLSDYSTGVFSDENGNFSISIPKQTEAKIIISHIGYETLKYDPDYFDDHSSIDLKEEAFMMEAATIEYVLPPFMKSADGSIVSYSKLLSQTSMTSGLLGSDILRYIQLMSGVAAFEDDNVDLKIRGSNSDNTRIILDEMPLYNVSHYYGIFASINSSFIEKMELYKNDQPIEHEGLGGGMLLLNSEADRTNGNSIDVNLLTAAVNLDLDLDERLSLKLSGRSSYRNVNDALLLDLNNDNTQEFTEANGQIQRIVNNQPDFKFHDFNASLVYRGENSILSINGFRSYDNLFNRYDLEINTGNQSFDRQLYENEETWENSAASIFYENRINKVSSINISSYFSNYKYDSELNSELRNENGKDRISNKNVNDLKDIGIKAFMSHNWSKSSALYGAEYKIYDVTHSLDAEQDRKLIDYKDDLNYVSLFGEYLVNLDNWSMKLGSRVPIFEDKKKTKVLVSPQLRISYRASDHNEFKFSVSKTNQILREIDYETRLGQNLSFYQLATDKEVPVLKTTNYMIGYAHSVDKWNFDIEFFYKEMKGILMHSTEEPGFIENQGHPGSSMYKRFLGDRRVRGIDMSLMYNTKSFTSWIAYTLSKSEDKFPQIFKSEYFASQDDRRHQIKWINQLNSGRWSFNSTFIYASGKPYLAFENINMMQNRGELNPKEVLNSLPDYLRLDLGVMYDFELTSNKAQIGLSVYNLSNRQNVKYIQYSYKLDSAQSGLPKNIIFGTESELLGRSLNLSFNLEF